MAVTDQQIKDWWNTDGTAFANSGDFTSIYNTMNQFGVDPTRFASAVGGDASVVQKIYDQEKSKANNTSAGLLQGSAPSNTSTLPVNNSTAPTPTPSPTSAPSTTQSNYWNDQGGKLWESGNYKAAVNGVVNTGMTGAELAQIAGDSSAEKDFNSLINLGKSTGTPKYSDRETWWNILGKSSFEKGLQTGDFNEFRNLADAFNLSQSDWDVMHYLVDGSNGYSHKDVVNAFQSPQSSQSVNASSESNGLPNSSLGGGQTSNSDDSSQNTVVNGEAGGATDSPLNQAGESGFTPEQINSYFEATNGLSIPGFAQYAADKYNVSNDELTISGNNNDVDQYLTERSSTAQQLNDLIASDSPYIEQARNAAMAQANSRGLLNSSMAAGAGVGAAIERALPIAQQDAQFYQNTAINNQSYTQDMSKLTQQQTHELGVQNMQNTAAMWDSYSKAWAEINSNPELDGETKELMLTDLRNNLESQMSMSNYFASGVSNSDGTRSYNTGLLENIEETDTDSQEASDGVEPDAGRTTSFAENVASVVREEGLLGENSENASEAGVLRVVLGSENEEGEMTGWPAIADDIDKEGPYRKLEWINSLKEEQPLFGEKSEYLPDWMRQNVTNYDYDQDTDSFGYTENGNPADAIRAYSELIGAYKDMGADIRSADFVWKWNEVRDKYPDLGMPNTPSLGKWINPSEG